MTLTVLTKEEDQQQEQTQPAPDQKWPYINLGDADEHRSALKSLSDFELLSYMLSFSRGITKAEQIAETLLQNYGTLHSLLNNPYPILKEEVGFTSANYLKAAVEMVERMHTPKNGKKSTIKSSEDIAKIVMTEMSSFKHEELWVVLLNAKRHILKIVRLYKGTMHTSVIRNAELFEQAITRKAAFIILVHNHPSGDCTPSPDDLEVTEQAITAGKLLDIEAVDHIIIADNKFYSIRALHPEFNWSKNG